MEQIEQIELEYLTLEDYTQLKVVMNEAYAGLPDLRWMKTDIRKLINKFPKGQVVIKVDGEVAGAAFSIIVNEDDFEGDHTFDDVTAKDTFTTHQAEGDTLYGIDVFISPKYRGLRLGRRLYDFRKELCEELNLKSILFGGRLPLYHQFSDDISPKEYIDKVKNKEINDPVLNFQLANDFHVKKIIKGYLPGDKQSKEYAALMEWNNIYYTKSRKTPRQRKSIIRLGLVQWKMRTYPSIDDLLEQVDYFVNTLARYNADFAVFPEFFNAPLMAKYNDLSESDAIRALAKYTEPLKEAFSHYAISYNINIITGSMPYLDGDDFYNVGHLCHRNGKVESYYKIHVTPDENRIWGLKGGNKVKTFDTDCGKVGILICYDVEFPELGRILADEGMQILFVPFLTDTHNAFSRVRHCAQARAIENECYVAIAGSIGNLPKVHNMDIQYGQSIVFTPCDLAFPADGIKAEATANTEMILVADVDLDLLRELHEFGSVNNLKDRRKDLYSVKLEAEPKLP